VRAQQAERVRRIGVLMNTAADDPEGQARKTAFVQALQQFGWTDGRNGRIETRWGTDAGNTRRYVAELVALAPDVIVAAGSAAMVALQQTTRTVPIIFVTIIDPVGAGFVESLARPGGNVTGFSLFEYGLSGKWLELLKEIAPGVMRVAVLRDTAVGSGVGQYAIIQAVAPSLGVELRPIDMRDPGEIERAVVAFARVPNSGLIIVGSPSGTVHRNLIITLAARHQLPAVYPLAYYVRTGGLISYGPDSVDPYRSAAGYVDRILKGEKPADLPVQTPTKYETVLNLKTQGAGPRRPADAARPRRRGDRVMKRREFITLLGGTAVAWPLAARAQQRAMPVIGFLQSGSPEPNAHLVAAFRQGLGETGYVEGRNVAVEYRWAHNDNNRLPELAADLVRLRVAVIATPGSTAAASAAKSATTTIPIVFSGGGDPVQTGLVASLNRPGGNVTGVSSMSGELGAKRLGLLQELVPRAARFVLLVNPNNPLAEAFVTDVRAAGAAIGRQIEVLTASTSRDIDTAFAMLVEKRANALLVGLDPLFVSRRVQLATLSARHAVPAIYPFREDAEAGGLISYGPSNTDLVRQAGIYTGRVLKGEKPAGRPPTTDSLAPVSAMPLDRGGRSPDWNPHVNKKWASPSPLLRIPSAVCCEKN
jgi:putative ABC transport system substrate-binding protein